MRSNVSLLFFGAALAAGASAQGTSVVATSVPASDPCIANCITWAAASAGCLNYAYLPCVCTSTSYWDAALSCLQNSCTADEVQLAKVIQQDQCLYQSYYPDASSVSSAASSFSSVASSAASSLSSVASSAASSLSTEAYTAFSSASSYYSSLSSAYSSAAASVSSSLSAGAASAAAVTLQSSSTKSSSAAGSYGFGGLRQYGGLVGGGCVALFGVALGAILAF